MEPKYIAAIEIASSKIKGAIGYSDASGNLSVLAVEEMPASNNVRYGRVQNIREVSSAVNDIIARLEASPAVGKRRIRALALSIGGRSLAGKRAQASAKFPDECEITGKHIQRLIFEAKQNFEAEKYIIEAIPRSYLVNNTATAQPVGTYGDSLRAEFLMISCARETIQNLERIKFAGSTSPEVKYIINAKATGDFVLSADDKELGTALVDVGAETTSVAIYKNGTLASFRTIPMGSRLINLDLVAGLGTTEEGAERMKREYAENPDGSAENVRNYVHSRCGEIAANVFNQIENSGLGAQAVTKIVITGGGARIKDLAEQVSALSKLPVRQAEMPTGISFRVAGRNDASNIDIVALLYAASRVFTTSCMADPEPEQEDEIAEEQEPVFENVTVEKMERPADEAPDRSRRTAAPAPVRDDEDDLLRDDPDNETEPEEEERPHKRFGIFGWGRKPSKRETKVEKNEFEEEEEDTGEYETTADTPADDDHFGETKKSMEVLRNRFIKIFMPPEGVADKDDENE